MTDTTTTTTSFSSLADELVSLSEQYKNDQEARIAWRQESVDVANQYFYDSLLASEEAWDAFTQKAYDSAKTSGNKTCRLSTWTGRGPSYRGQFLSDLLDLDNLLERFQDLFNERCGEGKFMVFKNPIVKGNGPRRFALTVSWDSDRFDNARSIITRSRESALEYKENMEKRNNSRDMEERSQFGDDHRHQNRSSNDDYDDRRPRRRYDDREPRQRRQYEHDRSDRPVVRTERSDRPVVRTERAVRSDYVERRVVRNTDDEPRRRPRYDN